jgi:hypothetical protein
MRGVHVILYSHFDADEWVDRKDIRAQVQIR